MNIRVLVVCLILPVLAAFTAGCSDSNSELHTASPPTSQPISQSTATSEPNTRNISKSVPASRQRSNTVEQIHEKNRAFSEEYDKLYEEDTKVVALFRAGRISSEERCESVVRLYEHLDEWLKTFEEEVADNIDEIPSQDLPVLLEMQDGIREHINDETTQELYQACRAHIRGN